MDTSQIHDLLSSTGHKLTAPRKHITKWLSNHEGIFSASELCAALKTLDKVSVYRTLELFCDLDIIHPVTSLHGEQHFEIHQQTKHHHHIVCTACEKNECIPCDIPKKKFTSFKNVHHSVVFTGLCNPCTA